jgi:hypothetical protein
MNMDAPCRTSGRATSQRIEALLVSDHRHKTPLRGTKAIRIRAGEDNYTALNYRYAGQTGHIHEVVEIGGRQLAKVGFDDRKIVLSARGSRTRRVRQARHVSRYRTGHRLNTSRDAHGRRNRGQAGLRGLLLKAVGIAAETILGDVRSHAGREDLTEIESKRLSTPMLSRVFS